MILHIRIGTVTTDIKKFTTSKLDDAAKQLEKMYRFLAESNNCTIVEADTFLLYALNNCMMSHIVRNSIDVEDADVANIPKIDPANVVIVEILEDGTERCIQTKTGYISKNYFDSLMKTIMNDYYACLNYFDESLCISND